MEYQATAKYLRTGTRKLRLIADSIRGLAAEEALVKLSGFPKSAALPMRDVVVSALANAKVKKADTRALIFKTIEVMGGSAMKRWHAVSRGQAHGYKKRMTHVRIILTDEESQKSKVKSQKYGTKN